MSELKAFDIVVAEEGYCEGIVKYRRAVYDKPEVDAVLADKDDEIRRLRRALWRARAELARSSALSYHLIEDHPDKDVAETYKRIANKWEKVKDKCLKKAELYK